MSPIAEAGDGKIHLQQNIGGGIRVRRLEGIIRGIEAELEFAIGTMESLAESFDAEIEAQDVIAKVGAGEGGSVTGEIAFATEAKAVAGAGVDERIIKEGGGIKGELRHGVGLKGVVGIEIGGVENLGAAGIGPAVNVFIRI